VNRAASNPPPRRLRARCRGGCGVAAMTERQIMTVEECIEMVCARVCSTKTEEMLLRAAFDLVQHHARTDGVLHGINLMADRASELLTKRGDE